MADKKSQNYCAVQFTVHSSDQTVFFGCIPSILPDLSYMIYEVNDLTLDLRVLFCFKQCLSSDQAHKSFDVFKDFCSRCDVRFTYTDSES